MQEISSSEEGEFQSSNSSSNDSMGQEEPLEFVEVKSKRGASLLTRDGFEYSYEKDSAMIDNVEYWRCPHRPPYCPGRIYVHTPWHENEHMRFKYGTVKNGDHTHNADYNKETIRNAVEQLKRHANEPNPTKCRNAVDEARATLTAEARVNAPSSSAFGQVFQRAKRKAAEQMGDRGMDTVDPIEMVIPQYLEVTVILNENVNIGGQNRKLIAFSTQRALHMLDIYRVEISIDGTFKTAPRGFGQMFTIHVVVDNCSIPCVFACLPTKHVQGYIRVFESVQNRIANWVPGRVMCDFEASEISAIQHVFPQAVITGCVFHLGNSLYKRIRSLTGLHARYKNNRNDKHLLRSLQALAFLPINHVYTFLCILMDALMGPPQMEVLELLKYFILTYIGPEYVIAHAIILPGEEDGNGCDGWLRAWIEHENLAHRRALFPIELWNLTDRLQDGLSRTNNSLESWHNVWGSLLAPKPLFSKFVKRMLKEFSRWDNVVIDFENAPANGIRGRGLKRKAVYLQIDQNIRQLFAEFDRRAEDPLRYLRAISYHLAEI